MNTARRLVPALVLAFLLPACAPRVSTPQVDDSDYVFPEIRRGEMTSRDEKTLHRAWEDLLAGRTARAEQSAGRLAASRPGLVPARVVLGFAALRATRLSDADGIFTAVLAAEPNDVAALVGLASVRRKQGFLDQALPLYVKAERLRPRDAALSRRASEVKLAVAEGAIAQAGALSAEGKKAEAIVMLQRAIEVAPELSPVRLELADLLVEAGRRTEALSVLGGAQDADRNIALRIASIRFEDGDLDGAEMALRRGLRDVAEDPEGAALLARVKDRRASLALPEPLRGISDAPRLTRAELAALVVEKVEALKSRKPAARGEVASDLSRTWARPQVLRAIELGLMDVYPNHTFQPSGVVRRGELAVVAARVLDLVGWGRSNGPMPRDMSPSHLQYSAVVRVVGSGVMQNAPSGAFEPWRIVTGAEAKAVVDALARLSSQR
ncbi:MAG: S-layer homology domain-containing protein [Vicinamibacteria bacterium]|nr:S-layer homology domain-containing protein [Vicinamibacteria bacterium]